MAALALILLSSRSDANRCGTRCVRDIFLIKMQWLAVCVLAVAICSGGGVTKTSGLEQFWMDDYKVFEKIYGKTSDKEIYGVTLPPNIGFDAKHIQASEKKERYLPNHQKDIDTYLPSYQRDEEDYEPYGVDDKYNSPTKPTKKEKQASSSFNFISYSDFKPISQNSDPETYNYLKHLEEVEEERKGYLKGDRNTDFPKDTGGFKPYMNYAGPNPEETDAYKSIQEILDSHEANKGSDNDADSKYLTYRENNKKKKSSRVNNGVSKPRCLPGRCRKRSSVSYRIRPRPYYRRIMHRIY